MENEQKEARILLIDDFRELNFFGEYLKGRRITTVARTFDMGLLYLKTCGPWDVLLLDHDLGEFSPRKTGYGICCWLEQNVFYTPDLVQLVTSNPVGRMNMGVVLTRIYPNGNLSKGCYWR